MKVPFIIVCLIVKNRNVGYETQQNEKYIFFDDKLNVQIGSLSLFLFYGLKTMYRVVLLNKKVVVTHMLLSDCV